MAIFKYLSADSATSFCSSLRLRFTQPSDLNDPFEFRPFVDFDATAAELQKEVDARIAAEFGTVDAILAMIEKMQRIDPNYPKIAVPIQVFRQLIAANPKLGEKLMEEMDRHKSELMESYRKTAVWEIQWEKFQTALGQTMGILSLTEDSAHSLMWSHYASQHTGIVLELDETHHWFDQRITPEDDFRRLVRVTYVQNPIPRSLKQLTAADVLYTKNAEWAYEREWRVIRPLRDGVELAPGKYCFSLPPDALLTVIFGCRKSKKLEETVRTAIAENEGLRGVRFKKIKLDPGGRLKVEDAPCIGA